MHCDAGWRPWTFVKVETDAGLVGWGECSDSRNPHGVAGCVRDYQDILIGEDHFTRETPQFTTAICNLTAKQGLAGLALVFLLLPAFLLGRWVYST